MHLGMLTNNLFMGGAEKLLLEMLRRWRATAADRMRITVYLLNDEGQLSADIHGAGWPVVDLHHRKYQAPRTIAGFARRLRRDRVDVLHCHLPRAGIVGRFAGRLAGCPTLYTEHSLWSRHHPATRAVNRRTIHLHDRVVAVTRAVRDEVLAGSRLPPHRVSVLHNGIDAARLRANLRGRAEVRAEFGIPREAFLLANTANLEAAKGHRVLLEALRQLLPARPDAHLVIAGRDRGAGAELAAAARAAGIADRVVFAGHQPDPCSIVASADLYVQPSLKEGMSIALLEAMAVGTPVVATAAGGTPDVVRDSVDGLLVPPGDAAALLAAMTRMVGDEGLRATLARAARERVEESFSLASLCEGYERAYAELWRGAPA
jgi:glycosyltransferase involved in cell wall biosynthesis